MSEEKVRTEEYKVTADETVGKVKALIAEGNVRRIIIQTEEGKNHIEFPLTVAVAAATGVLLLAPLLATVSSPAAPPDQGETPAPVPAPSEDPKQKLSMLKRGAR